MNFMMVQIGTKFAVGYEIKASGYSTVLYSAFRHICSMCLACLSACHIVNRS